MKVDKEESGLTIDAKGSEKWGKKLLRGDP